MGDKFLEMKLKDQAKSIELLTTEPQLKGLRKVFASLVDLEVRGVPALQYFGHMVWDSLDPPLPTGETKWHSYGDSLMETECLNLGV